MGRRDDIRRDLADAVVDALNGGDPKEREALERRRNPDPRDAVVDAARALIREMNMDCKEYLVMAEDQLRAALDKLDGPPDDTPEFGEDHED